MPNTHKVVITGMGCIAPCAFDESEMLANLKTGKSGITTVTHIDVTDMKTKVGGIVDRTRLQHKLQEIPLRYTDFASDTAMLAAGQALKQAKLITDPEHPLDIPVVTGSGVGCTEAYFDAFNTFHEKGARRMRPTSVPRCMSNAPGARISIRYHLMGSNFTLTTACASSTTAIGWAFRMIRHGYIKQALCIGVDTIFEPFTFAGFDRLGMMTPNPDPQKACRPFDANRDGAVIGEGAAALLLESEESARQRDVIPRSVIRGYGESSDAKSLAAPDVQGQTIAIKNALADAGIPPDQIGFINAHGTATVANDAVECTSIKQALGIEQASKIPIVSLKPFFGHLLGGSGALETLCDILALENNFIPPAMNITSPDDTAKDLTFAPQPAIKPAHPVVMKNSFGIGGSNAVLILSQP